MTEAEKQVVNNVLARMGSEMRGSQRAVEILANLFEDMRHIVPLEHAARIWFVLRQIPHLDRISLYPGGDKDLNQQYNRYRWVFFETMFPYDLMQSQRDMEQFIALLKREDPKP